MGDGFAKGLPYALLIVLLAGMFFVQQRMVASRAANPTMSAGQAKVMQYMPVAFAFFQVFLPTGLVVYYMVQAVVRIIQQWYITRRFYGEGGLGSAAQEASKRARDMKDDEPAKPAKSGKQKEEQSQAPSKIQSKRVTAPKDRPAPSGRPSRPTPPGKRNK
jgi:YidC/Oxa1 family membrane protein insertase